MNISRELFQELVKNLTTEGKLLLIKRNYGVNFLVHDESDIVRKEIAKRGWFLNELKNDPSWIVRLEVARNGYDLEELSKDKIADVRKTALYKLRKGQEKSVN